MTVVYKQLRLEANRELDALNLKACIRVSTGLLANAVGASEVLASVRKVVADLQCDVCVIEVGTTGMCFADPIVDIDLPTGTRIIYGNVAPESVLEIIHGHLVSGNPVLTNALATKRGTVPGLPRLQDHPAFKGQTRIALRNAGEIDPANLSHYIANGGFEGLDRALSELDPLQVIGEIRASGLRGRGGAAFSTGTKWNFLSNSPGDQKYILANCEEGDPGAFNDKAILETDPFTLIEGTLIAGYATGATNGIVFIRHGHHEPIDRTQKAIEVCYENGLLGTNIMGSEFNFEMEISLVGESYVAGEETALMEAIEGKRSMPRFRPPFPAAVGVWGKPSNINNIKTLAYVPEILRNGPEWFTNIGTESSSGTALVCLSGHIQYPGVVEVPFGMTVREILEGLGGGAPEGREIKFLQTGGPLGGLLSADDLDLELDFDEMVNAGAMFGSGGIIVADTSTSVVDLTRVLIAFDELESCGKCFPCRLGMSHLLEIMNRMCSGEANSEDLKTMERIGENMKVGSLCGHGQLGFNPVSSALKAFPEEFSDQISGQTESRIARFIGPQATIRGAHTLGLTPTSHVNPRFVAHTSNIASTSKAEEHFG